jgi:hypothetical protein
MKSGNGGRSIHFPNGAGSCPLTHGKRPQNLCGNLGGTTESFRPNLGEGIFLFGKVPGENFFEKKFSPDPFQKTLNYGK